MNQETIVNLIIYSCFLLVFLFFSFFFSGTETAFFTLNSLERENLRSRFHNKKKNFINRILSRPERLLITVLTGNTIVNIFATDFFVATITVEISKSINIPGTEIFSIVIMTVLILIIGEMMPKNLAVRHPVAFGIFSVGLLYYIEKLLRPITNFLNFIQKKILAGIKGYIAEPGKVSNELIALTAQLGYKEKIINKYELDMFESYIEFWDKVAGDVMSPRTELKGVDTSTSLSDLLKSIQVNDEEKQDYIYIYNKDIDHLIGYIDIKELLPFKYNIKEAYNLYPAIKPFHSVPESKKLRELFTELKERDMEIAYVVDEYGGTAGIITFQHLINEVLGHFYYSDDTEIIALGENWFKIPGDIEIDNLENYFNREWKTEKRTISGMLIEFLGEIPEAGTKVIMDDIEYQIKVVSKSKILLVEMRYSG